MKREKPIKGRPQFWMSDYGSVMNLHIIYPNKKPTQTLLFSNDQHLSGWYSVEYKIDGLKKLNNYFNWKTHFLGNL